MRTKRWAACLVLVMILSQACAPKEEDTQPATESKPTAAAKPTVESKPAKAEDGGGLWDNIPVMDGSTLEQTTDCPAKWAECKQCEHRIYVTGATAEEICAFYKEQMPKEGWTKLVYQSYPEGACMGTWMDGETRVLLSGGVRASDKKVFVGITVGRDCP